MRKKVVSILRLGIDVLTLSHIKKCHKCFCSLLGKFDYESTVLLLHFAPLAR